MVMIIVQTYLLLPCLLFNVYINIYCISPHERSFEKNLIGNSKSNKIKTYINDDQDYLYLLDCPKCLSFDESFLKITNFQGKHLSWSPQKARVTSEEISFIPRDSKLVKTDDTTKKVIVKVYTTGPLPSQSILTLSDSTTVENALIILPGITRDSIGAIILTDSIKELLYPHYDSIKDTLNPN